MRTLPGARPFPAELATRLASELARRAGQGSSARHARDDGDSAYCNRLFLESSPYLQQHAHNPVDWWPWCDEAFAQARSLGKPVFLSIGYSTCHWCHVMEEESFEDEPIAAFLNARYVAIKVDREERPDIDAVYMRAAQRLTGAGGWPLSVWLTPDREPFFAGTYFPPHAGVRGARIGFLEILTELVRIYDEEPSRVREAAMALAGMVRGELEAAESREGEAGLALVPDLMASTVDECQRGFDDRLGGLRLPHKFPSHVPTRLLLRHHDRTGDPRALHMAVHTLENMAKGGIYDHLAGGFHRYSTDQAWLLPHFEKMLYDNALLVVAYSEAWQVTRRPDFARVVRETCDELLRTFASPAGGFYSATDADSEGKEGTFFVWSEAEIRAELGPGVETELFLRHYGVTSEGNCELGNVLHLSEVDEDMVARLAPLRKRLAQARARRVPPLRDEKILAAWNGLAIGAFAIAGRVFDQPRYLRAAERAATFLLERMWDATSGRLFRSFRDERLGVVGFLDDYAFVAAGLLDLFESTQRPRWFHAALRLSEEIQSRFADATTGGWFMTSSEHEALLARERPCHDGAEPAGSSVAVMNAARLAVLTDQPGWRDVVDHALAFYLPRMREQTLTMTELLMSADYALGPVKEIVLVQPTDADKQSSAMRRVLRETFCPRKVLLDVRPDSTEWRDLASSIPLLANKMAAGPVTTAYVCRQGQCERPTTDPEIFARLISGSHGSN